MHLGSSSGSGHDGDLVYTLQVQHGEKDAKSTWLGKGQVSKADGGRGRTSLANINDSMV